MLKSKPKKKKFFLFDLSQDLLILQDTYIEVLITSFLSSTKLKMNYFHKSSHYVVELEFLFTVNPAVCIEEIIAQYRNFKIFGKVEEKVKVDEEYKI